MTKIVIMIMMKIVMMIMMKIAQYTASFINRAQKRVSYLKAKMLHLITGIYSEKMMTIIMIIEVLMLRHISTGLIGAWQGIMHS